MDRFLVVYVYGIAGVMTIATLAGIGFRWLVTSYPTLAACLFAFAVAISLAGRIDNYRREINNNNQ